MDAEAAGPYGVANRAPCCALPKAAPTKCGCSRVTSTASGAPAVFVFALSSDYLFAACADVIERHVFLFGSRGLNKSEFFGINPSSRHQTKRAPLARSFCCGFLNASVNHAKSRRAAGTS